MDVLLKHALWLGGLAALAAGCSGRSGERRSVSELFSTLESGHLFARRAAIAELAGSAPATPAELDLVAGAARQSRRLRLRDAALASLANVPPTAVSLRPRCRALIEVPDLELRRAALELCWRLRAEDSLARIEELWRESLSLRSPASLFLEEGPPPASRRLLHEAGARAREGNVAALERLFKDPAFLAGGFTAGREVAAGGRAMLPAAERLARGKDPAGRRVGLGIVLHARDPEAAGELRRLGADDGELGECARAALAELEGAR